MNHKYLNTFRGRPCEACGIWYDGPTGKDDCPACANAADLLHTEARAERLAAVVRLVMRGSPLAWPHDLRDAIDSLKDGDI